MYNIPVYFPFGCTTDTTNIMQQGQPELNRKPCSRKGDPQFNCRKTVKSVYLLIKLQDGLSHVLLHIAGFNMGAVLGTVTPTVRREMKVPETIEKAQPVPAHLLIVKWKP